LDDSAHAAAPAPAAVTTAEPTDPYTAPAAPAKKIDWPRRIALGLAIAAVGFGTVLWPPAYALLVLAIAVASLWEFAQLSKGKGPAAVEFPVALAAVVAYIALAYFGLIRHYESMLLGATVVIALATATFTAKENRLAASGYTLLGVLYIGKLLSYFVTIRAIPDIGSALTFVAIFTIAMTDISAMVVGTFFGRTPLTQISPRKTVEGAIGGLLVPTAIGAFALGPWLHCTWWEGAAVGAITSLAAQAGDLVESGLKRDARVKDAGSALLDHGGVLDRFDSYMFGGIGFYFALWLVGFAVPGLHEVMRDTQIR
jgi:phosphatidate cytidylyltransferase